MGGTFAFSADWEVLVFKVRESASGTSKADSSASLLSYVQRPVIMIG